MKFIKNPNLPNKEVGLTAVSDKSTEIINQLQELGISSIRIKNKKGLDTRIASHADMICHPLGGQEIIIASEELYLRKLLQECGFLPIESNKCIKSPYPYECALNAARIGNRLIANVKLLDSSIYVYCGKHSIKILPVEQGYAKCSVVVLNDHSLITADSSIANAAKNENLDVLQIRSGFIELKGYPYGFIGGTCGMIGKNKLAFAGNPLTHPDHKEILHFLNQNNIETLSLKNGVLADIGGIVPLNY